MSVAPVPDRPTRQDLVVPPRESNVTILLGAVACGCIGFGVVWALGLGRPVGRDVAEAVEAAPAEEVAGAIDQPGVEATPVGNVAEPALFSAPVGEVEPMPVDPWRSRPPVPREDTGGRYAGRTTAFAPGGEPEADPSTAAVEPEPLLPDPLPTDLEPLPDQPPPSDPVGSEAGLPPEPAAASTDPGLLQTPADDAVPEEDAVPPPADDPPPSDLGDQPPSAFLPPPSAFARPDASPTSPAPDLQPPPASAFAAAPAVLPPVPVAAPPAAFPAADPVVTRPLREPPRAAQPRVTAAPAIPPFAAAPPLVGGADAGRRLDADSAPAAPPGVGRPGPLQLEGVQTPQLAVEKRGPREIQVGKAARYEILVRNVGSVPAHDVVLRDAVPFGTALVATSPPAGPITTAAGTGEGELLWSLGVLAPGTQARVVMEVMPQLEGDIGSVASVSFRTDATVRSRSTKPDLRVVASAPEPTLIGRDVQVTITIVNPGSGVATGVVLEGFLPDALVHGSGRELEFDVGQLRPGESRTIDLVLGTRAPGMHAARLSARADGGIEIEQPVPVEVVAPALELAIDMPLRRFLQRPATCTIAMANAGTAPARSIELAAQLPPGMKFVRANNAGWHDERTNRVLWNLEELPPGETGTVEMVVMPVDLGPQKIAAAARSADGLADQVMHLCEVEGLAALFFEVADSEDPIEVDGVTEYIVRVGNQGTKPATGVRLSATLLGELEPVEAKGPVGYRVENLAIAFEPLAKLAPAEEAVYRIRVRGRRAGDQRVQVQLVSEDHPTPITKEEITRVYLDR